MLLSVERLLSSLVNELSQVGGLEGAGIEGLASQSLRTTALALVATRAHGGTAFIKAQFNRLLEPLVKTLGQLSTETTLHAQLVTLRDEISQALRLTELTALESAWREALMRLESLVPDMYIAQRLAAQTRLSLLENLVASEAQDLQDQLHSSASPDALAADTEIDAPKLTAYLREHFSDPSLEVSSLQKLPGGFGKLTWLFDVSGTALSGAFVMRRDMPGMFADTDCHHVHREYPLIRALHDRGFPVPDAVWLDTEHRLLPGGNFIIMRRSPGVAGGSVFAAQGGSGVPNDLTQTLAGVLARLHTQAPMAELGQLTDSIRSELWDLPLIDCVRHYLSSWLALFKGEVHLPSPAIASLFGWLLDNIPPIVGKPVLLHGDVGFHNFLFEERQLTAVLDWEFAHIGDPAEDLAYVRNTLGGALDWDAFMAAYRAAGGLEVDDRRLLYFQIWGHLRNACASNLASAKFQNGEVTDLKMVVLPHVYIPQFLRAAHALIEQWPSNAPDAVR